MRIAVLGASGRTGRQLVSQALAAGHEVRVLVRRSETITESHPRLTVLTGDAEDPTHVRELVRGVDAVVSAVGPGRDDPEACSHVSRVVREVLEAEGPQRYVYVSGSHVDMPGDSKDFIGRVATRVGRLLGGRIVADKQRELDALRASKLDWTAVRPSQLTNGPKTGRYRVSTLTPPGALVARADVADFILKELQEHRHGRQAPFIAR
ncbi:NAD(P)H-binding protein [Pyxidicoccus parkwayensis]|uniref:NAD(P)H-binding protein n=1 Tax=Pyxidicoccus parkwayensis TaxID=2813578 RepID=A0ABX7P8V0_9BACT|nr:NAD(P)H-binding protein [Pyxidicoccus parkwaysis]QSQ26863.1 NAD(P)H-binding protein [Pyxidicoccus parkwaysis]